MSFREDLYIQRKGTNQGTDIIQTPIFIGTARKLVSTISYDDSWAIQFDVGDPTVICDHENISFSTSYWNNVGNYNVETIDPTRTVLFCNTNTQNENIELGSIQYICFIIDYNTNLVIFTASLKTATFDVSNSTTKSVVTLVLNEPIPENINITTSDYAIQVVYVKNYVADITQFNWIDSDNTVVFNSANLHIYDDAGNLNGVISTTWGLYYKVLDYRYITLNQNDSIPDWLVLNDQNPLSQALAQHHKISNTPATFLSIPDEDPNTIMQALTIVQDNSLGNYIVPLVTDTTLNLLPLLSHMATNLEKDNIWLVNFLSYPAFLPTTIAEGSAFLQQSYYTIQVSPGDNQSFLDENNSLIASIPFDNSGNMIGGGFILNVTITRHNFTDPINLLMPLIDSDWDGIVVKVNDIYLNGNSKFNNYELLNAPDSFIISIGATSNAWNGGLGWNPGYILSDIGISSNPVYLSTTMET